MKIVDSIQDRGINQVNEKKWIFYSSYFSLFLYHPVLILVSCHHEDPFTKLRHLNLHIGFNYMIICSGLCNWW